MIFFQAEDGIRDATVPGVQTCALPIWKYPPREVFSTTRLIDNSGRTYNQKARQPVQSSRGGCGSAGAMAAPRKSQSVSRCPEQEQMGARGEPAPAPAKLTPSAAAGMLCQNGVCSKPLSEPIMHCARCKCKDAVYCSRACQVCRYARLLACAACTFHSHHGVSH